MDIQPVQDITLAASQVSFKVVEYPDGRFLEADLTNAVVPDQAAFWTVEINGGLRLKTTARQGSTLGVRLDSAVYGNHFSVTFSATTLTGEVLASTGEVQTDW